MNTRTIALTAVFTALAIEGLLYAYTDRVPDSYPGFFPVSCTGINSQNTSSIQRTWLANQGSRMVVRALALDDTGQKLNGRTFIVYQSDLDKQKIKCPNEEDTNEPAPLPLMQCDFNQARGQYIYGIFSPRIGQGSVTCMVPNVDVYLKAEELRQRGQIDTNFVFRKYTR